MIRPLLLASAVALAAPALAQDAANEAMAPPITEGVAAPDAPGQTAPNLAPGVVPTGTAADQATNAMPDAESTRDAASTATTASGTMSGTAAVGGPMEATEYPVCTRAITDNCLQTPRSPRPPG